MVEPAPDDLATRYDDDVVRHGETFDLDGDAFERARRRADRWGVGAFVHDADGRVLLVREDDRWILPGGAREPGESLEAGARREVREETGVDVELTGLAAISEQTFRHGDETVAFRFATFSGRPRETGLSEDPGREGEGIETAAWRREIPANTFDRGLVERLADSVTDP
jgi:ADP-ribose pyrophosphatase YjhB (NUDIX family)